MWSSGTPIRVTRVGHAKRTPFRRMRAVKSGAPQQVIYLALTSDLPRGSACAILPSTARPARNLKPDHPPPMGSRARLWCPQWPLPVRTVRGPGVAHLSFRPFATEPLCVSNTEQRSATPSKGRGPSPYGRRSPSNDRSRMANLQQAGSPSGVRRLIGWCRRRATHAVVGAGLGEVVTPRAARGLLPGDAVGELSRVRPAAGRRPGAGGPGPAGTTRSGWSARTKHRSRRSRPPRSAEPCAGWASACSGTGGARSGS